MKKLVYSLIVTVLFSASSFAQIGKWLAVAGADLVGAGAGVMAVKEIGLAFGTFTGGTGTAIVYAGAGIICGAGASYQAHDAMTPKTNSTTKSTSSVVFTLPSQFSEYNIGARHNEVLDNCYFVNASPQAYLYKYYDRTAIDFLYNHSAWPSISNSINAMAQSYETHLDFARLLSEHRAKNYITGGMSTFLSNFYGALSTAKTLDEALTIVNTHTGRIAGSGYSDHEKSALYASMSVAASSLKYWYGY